MTLPLAGVLVLPFVIEGNATKRPLVAVVTVLRGGQRWADDDLLLLLAALQARGISAQAVDWQESQNSEWERFDLVVIKSPWDVYSESRFQDYSTWLDDVGLRTKLLNAAPVMKWNLDKRHLVNLMNQGISIVPTRILECGEELSAPEAEFVVKPVMSGGAVNTARYRPSEQNEARRVFAESGLHSTSTALCGEYRIAGREVFDLLQRAIRPRD